MRLPWSALVAQVCLFILFVSSVLAGALVFIGYVWPSLPIPPLFLMTLQAALAVLFGGMLMVSLMLSARGLQILSGVLLSMLAIYQLAHLVLTGIGHVGRFELIGVPWLPYGPAVYLLLLGLVGLLGTERRYGRFFRRFAGVVGVLIGTLVWVRFLGQQGAADNRLLLGFSCAVSLFCIGYGIVLLTLPRIANTPNIRMERMDALVGALGVIGTFTLLIIASWGTQLQRQESVRLFLQSQELVLKEQLRESVALIERMSDRWSALGFVVPPELMQTELRRYISDLPALTGLLAFDQHEDLLVLAGKTVRESESLYQQFLASETQQWMRQVQAQNLSFAWMMPDPSQPMSLLLLVISKRPSQGMFLVSYDLQVLFDSTPQEYTIDIEGPSTLPMTTSRFVGFERPVQERIVLNLTNGPSLILVATAELVSLLSWQGALMPAILALGLLISFLLTVTNRLVRVQRQKSQRLYIEEQRWRSLFYQSPDAVFELSKDGRYRLLNVKATAITGIRQSDLGVLTYRDVLGADRMPPADFERFERAFNRVVAGVAQTEGVRFLCADGQVCEYECSFAPIVVDQVVVGVYVVAKDVSEHYRAEENQRLLTRSLETSDNAVLVIDVRQTSMPAVFVNSAFVNMTGYDRHDVLNDSFINVASLLAKADDVLLLLRVIENAKSSSLTVKNRRRDGTSFWNQIALAPVRDENGDITHYTASMKDVSDALEQERKLAYQATYDAITGLPNRAYFEGRLNQSMDRCANQGGHLGVLFIDLDEFKPINDTLGHRVGDEVLTSIAKSISAVVEPFDTLARFGGDEFVLLLNNLSSVTQAENMAKRVLERIGRVHRVADNELYVTASIGISYLNSASQTSARLLQQADMAMYKAKQQGRDTYVVYADDLEEKLSLRVSLRNDLQEAIKKEHLRLHYQPQVDHEGRVCGLEALLRWEHPVRGLIPPSKFIPIAEQTGQIIHVGHWVITQACREARKLLEMRLLHGRISVNLSALQFHRPGFVDTLQAILTETGLPPQHLELELTESVLMRNSEAAIAQLHALKKMGVGTSIDDFGTGYSSFSYLKNLPVERIKIDRMFVESVATNRKDAAVCQGIITMARQMGITVIAEGVETQEQYDLLRQFGCDVFQGFYFLRPAPFENISEWLKQQKN